MMLLQLRGCQCSCLIAHLSVDWCTCGSVFIRCMEMILHIWTSRGYVQKSAHFFRTALSIANMLVVLGTNVGLLGALHLGENEPINCERGGLCRHCCLYHADVAATPYSRAQLASAVQDCMGYAHLWHTNRFQ